MIARSLAIFGILTAVGLLTSISLQTFALKELKVGGPVYTQIICRKGLIANILPLPLYTVQSYMLAMEPVSDPSLATVIVNDINVGKRRMTNALPIGKLATELRQETG